MEAVKGGFAYFSLPFMGRVAERSEVGWGGKANLTGLHPHRTVLPTASLRENPSPGWEGDFV